MQVDRFGYAFELDRTDLREDGVAIGRRLNDLLVHEDLMAGSSARGGSRSVCPNEWTDPGCGF